MSECAGMAGTGSANVGMSEGLRADVGTSGGSAGSIGVRREGVQRHLQHHTGSRRAPEVRGAPQRLLACCCCCLIYDVIVWIALCACFLLGTPPRKI